MVKTIEFETELQGKETLRIPPQIASQLPETGKARVILLLEEDLQDSTWQKAAYEQFLREDAPEDSVYDKYGSIR